MSHTVLQRYKPKPKASDSFWVQMGIEDQETDRIEAVHNGFYIRVYHMLLKKTELSQSEFGHVTSIPVSTLKRRVKKNERFSTTESDAMYRLAALVKQASDLFGGDESKAKAWMKKKVYGLNSKRPIDMVSTSIDFQVVEDLIGRVKHGVIS